MLAVLATTPRVVGLVWGAHPPSAAAVLALTVFQGLGPLAYAWLNKLVLEWGRITEQGTHAELMALGGTYADLYEKQASRYR